MTKFGIRFTKPRQLIFEFLSNFSKPVTVQEINLHLKNKVDLVSIYRTLDLLKKSGMVNEIVFGDDKKRFEIKEKNNHHHHLICSNCGSVKDIEIKEKEILKKIERQSNFLIKKHNLEFFGLCVACQ